MITIDKIKIFKFSLACILCCAGFIAHAQTISRSFELRYFSHSKKADGETDFKGKTGVLNTDQRIEFLNKYADYGKLFWKDPALNKQVFSIDSARLLTKKIKPQPEPQVGKRLLTDEWSWRGYRKNQEAEENAELRKWQTTSGVIVKNEKLYFETATRLTRTVSPQDWRCFLQLDAAFTNTNNTTISLDNCAIIGTDRSGKFYYTVNGRKIYPSLSLSAEPMRFRFELDFTTKRFNLYIQDQLIADYVSFSDTTRQSFKELVIDGVKDFTIDNVTGTGYHKTGKDTHYPYTPVTYLDEDFSITKPLGLWYELNYDENNWNNDKLPVVHGGERHKKEDLYLRKKFTVSNLNDFASAILDMETLTPSGELYINGKVFEIIHNARPISLNIKDALQVGTNIIAIKIDHYAVPDSEVMTHTSTDRNTGWFAGRIHLDLLQRAYINDVYSYTESIANDQAQQVIKVDYRNKGNNLFKGKLRISISPWFPLEGQPAATKDIQIETTPIIENISRIRLAINNPDLWTADSPHLYLIKAELLNEAGNVVDDYLITTGVRTISQEGGTFRINNKPELLRAPLLFGDRAPLEKIAAWDKCPPAENIVQEMMMIKHMNGNGIRMSIHDSHSGGINDPRMAEVADQLGLMLIWQTTSWLREGNVFSMDFEGLTQYVKQVRNHPSITIWQPSNHPNGWFGWDGIVKSYKEIYNAIVAADSSRLISPSADYRHMLVVPNDEGTADNNGKTIRPDPVWTAPLITRGSMDYMGGYGAEWTTLRKWPFLEKDERPMYYEVNEFQTSFLNSKDRAYFNFEHDESIGQPNWSLIKGKPWYLLESYEWDYDIGSIGRRLRFDEWQASQAWQALIAYESIKKIRMMDYDGLSWCNLRGGANMATYQKPLIDYLGYAKLAFYAHNMGYQNTMAGSKNVDMVYGPGDMITPLLFNLGNSKIVNLTMQLKNVQGKVIETKRFNNIILEEGRNTKELQPFRFSDDAEGIYVIEYILSDSKK